MLKKKKGVRKKETRIQITAFSHITLRPWPFTAPSCPALPSVSLAVLETELHKLAYHKHEISLAFISILHLTVTPTQTLCLFHFGGCGLPGVSPWWFGGRQGKLQTQIENLGKDAVRPEDSPIRTQMAGKFSSLGQRLTE